MRVAQVMKWEVDETRGFSWPMLREMVRRDDPALWVEIGEALARQQHVLVPVTNRGMRRGVLRR